LAMYMRWHPAGAAGSRPRARFKYKHSSYKAAQSKQARGAAGRWQQAAGGVPGYKKAVIGGC